MCQSDYFLTLPTGHATYTHVGDEAANHLLANRSKARSLFAKAFPPIVVPYSIGHAPVLGSQRAERKLLDRTTGFLSRYGGERDSRR